VAGTEETKPNTTNLENTKTKRSEQKNRTLKIQTKHLQKTLLLIGWCGLKIWSHTGEAKKLAGTTYYQVNRLRQADVHSAYVLQEYNTP